MMLFHMPAQIIQPTETMPAAAKRVDALARAHQRLPLEQRRLHMVHPGEQGDRVRWYDVCRRRRLRRLQRARSTPMTRRDVSLQEVFMAVRLAASSVRANEGTEIEMRGLVVDRQGAFLHGMKQDERK